MRMLRMIGGGVGPTAEREIVREEQQLRFVRDKHYALHGKIMMLVLFTVFAAFICCVAVFPCVRRLRRKGFSDDETNPNAAEPSPPPQREPEGSVRALPQKDRIESNL